MIVLILLQQRTRLPTRRVFGAACASWWSPRNMRAFREVCIIVNVILVGVIVAARLVGMPTPPAYLVILVALLLPILIMFGSPLLLRLQRWW